MDATRQYGQQVVVPVDSEPKWPAGYVAALREYYKFRGIALLPRQTVVKSHPASPINGVRSPAASQPVVPHVANTTPSMPVPARYIRSDQSVNVKNANYRAVNFPGRGAERSPVPLRPGPEGKATQAGGLNKGNVKRDVLETRVRDCLRIEHCLTNIQLIREAGMSGAIIFSKRASSGRCRRQCDRRG